MDTTLFWLGLACGVALFFALSLTFKVQLAMRMLTGYILTCMIIALAVFTANPVGIVFTLICAGLMGASIVKYTKEAV